MALNKGFVLGKHLILGVKRHALQDVFCKLVRFLEILILGRYSIIVVRF